MDTIRCSRCTATIEPAHAAWDLEPATSASIALDAGSDSTPAASHQERKAVSPEPYARWVAALSEAAT